ncbi:MAG TPA: hypothetical protein VIV07_02205 [Sphingomicrobium sp.]
MKRFLKRAGPRVRNPREIALNTKAKIIRPFDAIAYAAALEVLG